MSNSSTTPTRARADEQQEKIRENRLRRMAHRQGLVLQKSHRRDPMAMDYGKFQIVDPYVSNVVVAGALNSPLALTLDEVEDYLTSAE